MDSAESGPTSPESDKQPLVLLRSATPSESSSSKPVPEAPVESPVRFQLPNPSDDEASSSVSEDIDPDEQILAEGGIKDWEDLQANGFDPVWVEGFFPGEIPEEIAEYLGSEKTNKSIQMIGSNRSIFWLFGLNDLVKVIDDQACLLEDEVVLVPLGIHPVGFLLDRYVEEQKIPRYIFRRYEKYFTVPSFSPTAIIALPLLDIPSRVTDGITRHRVAELYPLCRPQILPETVLCLKMKRQRSIEKLEAQLRNQLRDSLDLGSGEFLFRGLSRLAASLSMTSFSPVISSTNFGNEFGPGIYATNDLATALNYAGLNGAVMVFKNTNFQKMSVWSPDKNSGGF